MSLKLLCLYYIICSSIALLLLITELLTSSSADQAFSVYEMLHIPALHISALLFTLLNC